MELAPIGQFDLEAAKNSLDIRLDALGSERPTMLIAANIIIDTLLEIGGEISEEIVLKLCLQIEIREREKNKKSIKPDQIARLRRMLVHAGHIRKIDDDIPYFPVTSLEIFEGLQETCLVVLLNRLKSE